jgi:alcohol dehydrogenase
MKSTYRAMQIGKPGVLELVERPTPTPGPGEVLIEVQACGICGADVNDIEKADTVQPPRVPGHEVVGRLAAMGPGVPSRWKIGQRVGIGRLGGHCNECGPCRQGMFQLCQNQHFVGATCDGGYAEMMLARATGLVAIPDALNSEEAAPILCAGVATLNALKKSGAQAGDTVAILGIGGLGHMAIQYARRMGFKVVALGRGGDKEQDVLALGAHVYVDTEKADAASKLKAMGGAHAIVTTIPNGSVASALLHGLAPQGRLVVLGAGRDSMSVAPGHLVVGERSVLGSLTGTPYEAERTLDFSVLADVRPIYESLPLERAEEAYQRLKRGDVKFRLVLTMPAA